ncbi:MAG: DUF3307 domain-containing protein [Bacteroidaceae bacterium]|nr:DUF3307 domain-containing protein [Bacteroidaceae bacterium]
MEAFIVLIKLLCAHLCSDFIFQTDAINTGKRKSGSKGLGYQMLHSMIHAIVAYLFVADWSCWLIPVVILVSHFFIDMIKCKLHKDSLTIFLADQLAHIIVIGLLWFFLYGKDVELSCMLCSFSANVWLIGLAYILMLKPSSILLSLFLDKWTPASPNTQSLPNAGQWIGYIERILILTFVLIGSMEGVGFLLAAKSIFRFGQLNKAKEIRTTEYVLIGTLASFTIAILTGIAVSHLI